MGLFDIFSSNKNVSKVDKIAKKMLNEHHQQQVRQEAIHELIGIGTPESIRALVSRLGVNFRDTIKNEQEKTWVTDILVNEIGPDAIEPMVGYIRSEQAISAVIRALTRLVSSERIVTLLIEVLRQYAPTDHRTMAARQQIIDALFDYDAPEIIDAVTPYLLDHDDDVRIKVIDLLEGRVERGGERFGTVVDGLASVLKDPMASGRITRRAAQYLSGLNADLSKQVSELAPFMPDGYTLGTNGRITKT